MKPSHAELAMVWGNMIARCYDPKTHNYHRYGGRGIRVCKRWHVFTNFTEDMAPRPPGLSLDRIDVNGGYSPKNCRWADSATQDRNRRDNTYLTIGGETMVIQDWAARSGTCHSTIRHRIKQGWPAEQAVFGRRFAKRYPDIIYDGYSLSIPEWAKLLGISRQAINRKMREGATAIEVIKQYYVPWDL